MPFNNSKNGYQNEYAFVKLLNLRKLREIPYHLQLFILDMFGEVDGNATIFCFKNPELQKYDVSIKIGDEIKIISIKKSVKNSVHAEPITEMIHFLIENKMPRYMIVNFLKYHYADGTTNGKGIRRISVSEYKIENQKQLIALLLRS